MSRNTRSKRGRNINLKQILYVILGIAILGYTGYFIYTLFNIKTVNPLAQNNSQHMLLSTLQDDLEETVYVFEKGEGEKRRITDVYVFLFNKEKQTSLLIHLPGSLYFDRLEEEFGSPVALSSLYYAGEYLQEGRGVEYTLWQLSNILGFKFSNYVWLTPDSYGIFENVYGDVNEVREKSRDVYKTNGGREVSDSFLKLHTLSQKYSNTLTFFRISDVKEMHNQIYTNMTFLSVLRNFNMLSKSLVETEVYAIDMNQAEFSEDDFSDLGGQIRAIDTQKYDEYLEKYIQKVIPKDLERERARVELYNASRIEGMASIYARKLRNSGCDVVRFGNAPDHLSKTGVYVSDIESFSSTYDVVSEVLLSRFEEMQQRPSFMTTGDIVILLGEDVSHMQLF